MPVTVISAKPTQEVTGNFRYIGKIYVLRRWSIL